MPRYITVTNPLGETLKMIDSNSITINPIMKSLGLNIPINLTTLEKVKLDSKNRDETLKVLNQFHWKAENSINAGRNKDNTWSAYIDKNDISDKNTRVLGPGIKLKSNPEIDSILQDSNHNGKMNKSEIDSLHINTVLPKYYNKTKATYDRRYSPGAFDSLSIIPRVQLVDLMYNVRSHNGKNALERFPNFVEGIHNQDTNLINNNYKRNGVGVRNDLIKEQLDSMINNDIPFRVY